MMTKKLFLDLLERAAWTFAQAFLALFLFTGELDTDIDTAKKAAVAGIAAVIALAKGVVASRVGDHGTAATLPASTDPAAPGA
jgi:hypothetical protein